MKKTKDKKSTLKLNTTTVKALSNAPLKAVVGGWGGDTTDTDHGTSGASHAFC